MMLIVTGVGALIVAYSVGYMEGENEERRYFAYMSLFVFSMLLLVQSGNLLLLLAGWGMVGLSSYLLIGFYQQKPEAIAAAKKAFIMNAFGDATMALALFLLIQQTGQLDFAGVFAAAPHGGTIANLIALGLLGGAVAKSAQIPLHTWLPDAMEGPTPVSALIHAATMVTAGVYLIVRTNPLFHDAPKVQDLAAGLGVVTLLIAGVVALVQVDIKRVIAYSTMSQIGYMFVGAGIGAYSAAMFHLMAHAFFKGLLFLTAGIIIHALSGEQDMRRMGGLRKVLPHTRTAFLIGSLALVGLPPLAGFFSKDAIIDSTLARGDWFGYLLFAGCLVGTFFTGLYAFRLYFIVFYGEQSAFAQRASAQAEGPARGAALDGLDRHHPRRPLGDRRLPAVLAALAPAHDLARPDRAASRRADEDPGRDRLDLRRPARPHRHLGRLRLLRQEEHPDPQARQAVREEVLLRRALRRGLLQARRPDLARPRPLLRDPRDRRLARRDHPGLPLRLG